MQCNVDVTFGIEDSGLTRLGLNSIGSKLDNIRNIQNPKNIHLSIQH